jgi:molybdopterin-guanine dinucleotide biosynthesis protein A
MIRRVADRIATVIDELIVNCREGQIEAIKHAFEGYPIDPAYAIDPKPDLGPMAGIRNGLQSVSAEYAFVIACDMPFVSPALAEYLFLQADGYDAAVPRSAEGWYQTTQAVYRASAMVQACDRALEAGDSRIVDALFELDYVEVSEDEVLEHTELRTFENLNTEAEFDAAADSI